ncbi:MAG: flippase [Patescibacteria group bacterium]
MSLLKQVAQNTIIQIAGKIIGSLLALISVGFMLRYLKQTGFGQYTTIISFLSMFSILADLGLYLTVTREISKPKVDESKIINNAFTLKLVSSLIILSLGPIVALFFPYSPLVKLGILIGSISFLFVLLNQILIGIFQKYLNMLAVAVGEIAGRIFWLFGILLVIKLNLGLIALIWAIAFSNFINFLIVFILAQKYVKIRLAFDFKYWKYLLKIAAPLAISVIFNLIYFKVDTVILSVFKPERDVGIYGAPYKVLESLITFAAIFAGILLPILSKYIIENFEKFKRLYRRSFDVIAIFILPLIVGVVMLARPIMVFFGGGEFAESENVLRILIFACGAIYFSHLFGNSVVACNEQKKMMWIYFLTAASSIILNFVLIPPFSYYGAAISVLISEIIVCFALALVVYKKTRVFPQFKIFGKSLFATATMALFIYFAPQWHFLITVALASLLYFAILYILRGFSKEVVLEIIGLKIDQRSINNNN